MLGLFLWAVAGLGIASGQIPAGEEPFWKWSLAKAVKILNSSAWARQETFTTVVAGVGSGQAGEKEIYTTFYVRFLSADPIREAYARILQIEHGYDRLTPEEKRRFDEMLAPVLEFDTKEWVVVGVSFRSNDPEHESQIRRFFQSQTTATLRDKAYLSTSQHSQIRVRAYFPPIEESVGAKFVFPRKKDGTDLFSANNGRISFELLDLPVGGSSGGGQRGGGRGGGGVRGSGSFGRGGGGFAEAGGGGNVLLRATFSMGDMILDGRLIL